jgi:hypothetical protein
MSESRSTSKSYDSFNQNVIKKAHQFRILHRDIRRSNIIEIFNQKLIGNKIKDFIDFSEISNC